MNANYWLLSSMCLRGEDGGGYAKSSYRLHPPRAGGAVLPLRAGARPHLSELEAIEDIPTTHNKPQTVRVLSQAQVSHRKECLHVQLK